MTTEKFLEPVKNALGITGDYQDETIQGYIQEVMDYLVDAGVPAACITPGIVARGVSDLWNYASGDARFSAYFMQRAIQLAYKSPQTGQGGDASLEEALKGVTEKITEIHEAVVSREED